MNIACTFELLCPPAHLRTQAMFVLMKKTWEWNPADRPSSADVALELDGMLQEYSTKACQIAVAHNGAGER